MTDDCTTTTKKNNKRNMKRSKQEQEKQREQQQEEKTTEKVQWLLEGSHGMTRDADAAFLEEKMKHGDAEAMRILGVL